MSYTLGITGIFGTALTCRRGSSVLLKHSDSRLQNDEKIRLHHTNEFFCVAAMNAECTVTISATCQECSGAVNRAESRSSATKLVTLSYPAWICPDKFARPAPSTTFVNLQQEAELTQEELTNKDEPLQGGGGTEVCVLVLSHL